MEELAIPPAESQPDPVDQGGAANPSEDRRIKVNLALSIMLGQIIRVTIEAPFKQPAPDNSAETSPLTQAQTPIPHIEITKTISNQAVDQPAIIEVVSPQVELTPPMTPVTEPETINIPSTFQQEAQVPTPEIQSVPNAYNAQTTWIKQLFHGTTPVTPSLLLGIGILIYLLTHVIGLVNFPIYYTADEASVTVYGADLVSHSFHDNYGEFLPTFFVHDKRYNLGLLVYIQTIVFLFVGKSVFFSRLVIVLASLMGAVWVSLTLRDIFKLKTWWLGMLFMAVTPCWFLLSRGVYDVTLMASLFAGFIYYYLLYRTRSPRYLYTALVIGGLTFYSYTGGQILMVVIGLMLFFSDLRYHWQHRKIGLIALGVIALLALPFIRFLIIHPGEYTTRVAQYGSLIGQNISPGAKVLAFLGNSISDLNPLYWFFPNSVDQPMYVMKGYGHLIWPMLPFALFGLGLAISKIRMPQYRVLVLSLLAVPAAPALVTLTVYRALAIVVPLILLTTIGFIACIDWVGKKRYQLRQPIVLAAFVGLTLFNFGMLRDSLVNGPTWFKDYGMDGMQYGAPQVYAAAISYAKSHPEVPIYISPNWTFLGDIQQRFFAPDISQIHVGSADIYTNTYTPGVEKNLFVLIPSDIKKITDSGWFKPPQVELTIPYPDGTTGFYFTRLLYKDNIEQLVAAEIEKRHQLLEQDMMLNSLKVHVRYSPLDMGPIDRAFDGNLDTLVKSDGANPLVIEIEFPTPTGLSGLTAQVGSETVDIKAILTDENGNPSGEFTQHGGDNSQPHKAVTINFGRTIPVTKLRFELKDTYAPEPSPVHLWEILFK